MSCRLGSTISKRRSLSRFEASTQQRLRVAAVLELHLEVLAEVGDLGDAGQRLDERAVALEGERHGVLAVAGLHLRDGAVEDLLAAIDERDAVAEPLDRLHLVARQHDRGAGAPHVDEHLAHHVRADRIEPAHRLVHDQHVGLVQHRGDELRLLLHALRQLVGLALAPVGEREPLEPGADALARLPRRHALDRRHEDELLLEHHARVEPALLGHVADAVARRVVGGLAEDLDRAGVGPQDVHHHPERRGLAGAVRPEQAEDALARNLEREIGDGHVAGEGLANALQHQRVVVH